MARPKAAEQPDESELALHPKLAEHLTAHAAVERQLLALINAKRLPHALLLTGPRGIGKATLAYRLARFMLAPVDTGASLFVDPLPPESLHLAPAHPTFRRVALGSHPDMLVLEAEDIKVEDTRKVAEFLSLTPAESAWRVVIIDSADAMNRNAANALLKTLEEPPAQALLILLSHNPGTLLPTIRSRCRALRLQPLAETDFARIMGVVAPDVAAHDYPMWGLLSGHSPGVALTLIAAQADALYKEILECISVPDTLKLHAFADRFARKEALAQWQVFSRLLLWLLARIAAQDIATEVFPGERAMLERLAAARPLDSWTELWEKAGRLLADADHIHLDRKQVIITLLRAMGE